MNIQNSLPSVRSVQHLIFEIFRKKRFTQIYKGFYGDAMLVFLLRGANMATGKTTETSQI